MRQFLDRASMSFAAGAFGALVASLAIWAAGAYHLTARLGIDIAPGLTANWLCPRIVWGGLWGFLFMLPMVRGHWWLRGIVLGLAPSAFQLLYVFPHETGEAFSASAWVRDVGPAVDALHEHASPPARQA